MPSWVQLQDLFDESMEAASEIYHMHSNLLEEPGFETSGSRWTLGAGTTVVTTDTPLAGVAHLKVVTLNGSDRFTDSKAKIFASPGDQIFAESCMKASVGTGANATAFIDWYDSSGSILTGLSTTFTDVTNVPTTYTAYRANMLVPEGAVHGIVRVGAKTTSTSSINLFVDDMVVAAQSHADHLANIVRIASELFVTRYIEGV